MFGLNRDNLGNSIKKFKWADSGTMFKVDINIFDPPMVIIKKWTI